MASWMHWFFSEEQMGVEKSPTWFLIYQPLFFFIYVRKVSYYYQGYNKVNNDRNLQFSLSCVLSSSWIDCSGNRISNCFHPNTDSLCFGSEVDELPLYSVLIFFSFNGIKFYYFYKIFCGRLQCNIVRGSNSSKDFRAGRNSDSFRWRIWLIFWIVDQNLNRKVKNKKVYPNV